MTESTRIIAIDPGEEKSALLYFDRESMLPTSAHIEANHLIRKRLAESDCNETFLAIEYTPPYTLAMGNGRTFVPNQVVLTAIEIGRFIGEWDGKWELVSRIDVKKSLLGRASGNDAAVRQAIYDRYGGTRQRAAGTKKSPGPIYGIKSHAMAALAVAMTWCDCNPR